MEFRKINWFDTENLVEKHGIQVKNQKSDQWCHCHENGKPLIYDTTEECNAKIRELMESESEMY